MMFTNNMQYQDGILYFLSEGVLHRLICSTGNVTTVCLDPLCLHDKSSCPLYKQSSYIAAPDGMIYFNQQYGDVVLNASGENIGINRVAQYARYDPIDSKKKVYYSYISDDSNVLNIICSIEFFTDKYRFYNDYIMDDKGVWNSALIRMNLDNGERDLIKVYSSGETQKTLYGSESSWSTCLYGDSEKIILLGDEGIYSLSVDGEKREIIKAQVLIGSNYVSNGKSLIYLRDNKLFSLPISVDSSNEEKLIAENVYNFKLTENYIYFWTNDEVNLGKISVRGYLGNELIVKGNTLMRSNYDGSGLTEVFTFAEDYETARAGQWIVAGNYVYMTYTQWHDNDGDGIYEDGDQYVSDHNGKTVLLRVDIESGELIEIHAN